MTAKKYCAYLAIALFAFIILNLVMWHCFTLNFWRKRDLNRLGNFNGTDSLTPEASYTHYHTEFNDYLRLGLHESFDVITIGDSFSNGKLGSCYQNYLTEKYGLKVLNFKMRYNCLEDLYILLNSSFIDEIKPRFIILESVGRFVQDRLGRIEIDITKFNADDILLNHEENKSEHLFSGLFAPIMIKANYNYLYNLIYRYLNPEQLSPEVYINQLDRNLFTNPGYENFLLNYFEDLKYLREPLNPDMINLNLNNTAKILSEKNIKLLFMPCVDKYDLYYPYIINKHGRPENDLFEKLEELPDKNYMLVNTKKILRSALELGEKDLYWFGDSHWSWKGFQIVCDEFAREIL